MNSLFSRLAFLFVLQFFISSCDPTGQEDLVFIPDPYFLNALIELGVDEDGDGQISYPEAEATLSIRLQPSSISDLSGLEAFINLDSLMIKMNPLSALDVTNNTSLKFLECTGCELTDLDLRSNPKLNYLDCSGGASLSNRLSSLDLSGNPNLEFLDCAENKITSLDLSFNRILNEFNCGRNLLQVLDVSNNSGLTRLMCNNNYLTSFDVSNNQNLIKLITCGNQLHTLDISANTGLKLIGVDNMSTITEVCVWTTPFPPEGVVVLSDFSPHVFFTTSCTN